MPDRLDKFKQILTVLDEDRPSTKEVVAMFEALINFLKDIRVKVEQELADSKGQMTDKLAEALNHIKNAEKGILDASQRAERQVKKAEGELLSAEGKLEQSKIQLSTDTTAFEKKVNQEVGSIERILRSELRTTMRFVEQEVDRVRGEIPEIPDIPEIPELPDVQGMVDKLREEHKEELEKLRKEFQRVMSNRAMGMKKITSVRSVNLTSQTNGSLKAFTMPSGTLKVLGVWGTQFPITFDEDVDFTFVGRTLTLTGAVDAPAADQTLMALIETQFYAG